MNDVKLGANLDSKETFQAVVKSGSWFAASVNDCNSYSLISCTVSPGFDYDDWVLADIMYTYENVSATALLHKSLSY